MDRDVALHPAAAVALAVPEARVELPLVVQLDDLRAGDPGRDAWAAKRIMRTAPSAKFGTTRHRTPFVRASSSSAPTSSSARPVVPTTVGTPAARRRSTLARTASGRVASRCDIVAAQVEHVAAPRLGDLVPGLAKPRPTSADPRVRSRRGGAPSRAGLLGTNRHKDVDEAARFRAPAPDGVRLGTPLPRWGKPRVLPGHGADRPRPDLSGKRPARRPHAGGPRRGAAPPGPSRRGSARRSSRFRPRRALRRASSIAASSRPTLGRPPRSPRGSGRATAARCRSRASLPSLIRFEVSSASMIRPLRFSFARSTSSSRTTSPRRPQPARARPRPCTRRGCPHASRRTRPIWPVSAYWDVKV